MRIAFVGKGGSGKTTTAVLFAQYVKNLGKNVVLVDADLNMHTPVLLGHLDEIPLEKHISHPASVRVIQTYLKGDNDRIKSLQEFRKTTPPTKKSRQISQIAHTDIFKDFITTIEGIHVMLVGTYQEDGIGTACYHNNLSIFENILTHLTDTDKEILVADMVAGIDSFANTLHTQFDVIVLVVEPTLRGIGVYHQFDELSKQANTNSHIVVIGNKVQSEKDEAFLRLHIQKEMLLGFIKNSDYIREVDQEGGILDISRLETKNMHVFDVIFSKLIESKSNQNERYDKLLKLHRQYVSQASIKERFGDLTLQIDPEYSPTS